MTGDIVTRLIVAGRLDSVLETLRLHDVRVTQPVNALGRRVAVISNPTKPGQIDGFDPKTTGYVLYVGAFGEDFVGLRRLLRVRFGEPFSTLAFGLEALRRNLPPDDDKGVPA